MDQLDDLELLVLTLVRELMAGLSADPASWPLELRNEPPQLVMEALRLLAGRGLIEDLGWWPTSAGIHALAQAVAEVEGAPS